MNRLDLDTVTALDEHFPAIAECISTLYTDAELQILAQRLVHKMSQFDITLALADVTDVLKAMRADNDEAAVMQAESQTS